MANSVSPEVGSHLPGMTQCRVLASEGRQRYIYTKTHKNIKEKKIFSVATQSCGNNRVQYSRSHIVLGMKTSFYEKVIKDVKKSLDRATVQFLKFKLSSLIRKLQLS